MNPGDLQAIESQRQALLGQLTAAETALRSGLPTRGFGETARAHMERARAHICEAYIAINESKSVRTVQQLVDALNIISEANWPTSQRTAEMIRSVVKLWSCDMTFHQDEVVAGSRLMTSS